MSAIWRLADVLFSRVPTLESSAEYQAGIARIVHVMNVASRLKTTCMKDMVGRYLVNTKLEPFLSSVHSTVVRVLSPP